MTCLCRKNARDHQVGSFRKSTVVGGNVFTDGFGHAMLPSSDNSNRILQVSMRGNEHYHQLRTEKELRAFSLLSNVLMARVDR